MGEITRWEVWGSSREDPETGARAHMLGVTLMVAELRDPTEHAVRQVLSDLEWSMTLDHGYWTVVCERVPTERLVKTIYTLREVMTLVDAVSGGAYHH